MPDTAPLVKYYESTIQDGPCAANEAIGLITTDRVDRDGEVVVPGGIDLTEYRRNPVVMYGHAEGKPSEGEAGFPVGQSLWIKPSRDGSGLVAKHAFDTEDDFAARVCGKVKRSVLKCYSIRFLPVEFGRPTREEIDKHPAWAKAKTVYRKTKLLEYSVVAMPANVDAVTLAKRGKSVEETEAAAEAVATLIEDETPIVAADEPVSKAAAEPEDADEDEAEDEAEAPPLKRGDHVRCMAKHCKGHGVVASVHKGEMVPDVEEDLYGSHEEPAARVKMYKRVDGGYQPTSVHKGVSCKDLAACDELKPPGKPKKKATPPSEPPWTPGEAGAYQASVLKSPAFRTRLADRVNEMFEVKVLGKV